jgi:hypothetical protein
LDAVRGAPLDRHDVGKGVPAAAFANLHLDPLARSSAANEQDEAIMASDGVRPIRHALDFHADALPRPALVTHRSTTARR